MNVVGRVMFFKGTHHSLPGDMNVKVLDAKTMMLCIHIGLCSFSDRGSRQLFSLLSSRCKTFL